MCNFVFAYVLGDEFFALYKTSFCLLSSYKNILFDNQFLLPFLGLWADCILMQVVTWHKALLVLKLKALSTTIYILARKQIINPMPPDSAKHV